MFQGVIYQINSNHSLNMSSRQVKKMMNKKDTPALVESEKSSDEEEEEPQNRFGGFKLSDDEDFDVDQDEEEEKPAEPIPKTQISTKIKTKKDKPKENFDISDLVEQNQAAEEAKDEIRESCLKRDAKFFDSESELQKLFQEKKMKTKSRSKQKSFILTPSISHPPNMKIGYLPVMERKDNLFYFDMSKGYLKLHSDFLFCVESNDPGHLHEFSYKYPFHIEALYQLALFYKMQAKYEQVYQFLERLLFAFQLSFHHQFSPVGRDIQMSMTSSNLTRTFFKSIFLFIDCLGRKGCYRTALEFSKFLLSLDQRDPLGALFLIDFYSISTRNYDYFVSFSAQFMIEYQNKQRTLNLPSSLYNLALCKALQTNSLKITSKDSDRAFELSSINSLHKEPAGVILLCAISSYPRLCRLLLNKLSPSFEFTYDEGIDDWDYSQIAEIFVTRNLELWRNDAVITWLKQAAEEAEIVGKKNFEDIWVYEGLETENFSFVARNLIPQDMAFK